MATLERNQPMTKLPKEMCDAINAGRFWGPQGIGSFMAVRSGEVVDVQAMAKELRSYVEKLNLSDDRILTDELLGLTRAMVDRLNWLAEPGKLGDAPRKHETWPINYAPDASKGASKWGSAKELYEKLGCGKDARIARIAGQVCWKDRWTELADCGVKAAWLAKNKAPWVDEQIRNPKLHVHSECWQGRTKIEGDYYLCRDGDVIVWPSWAEQSRGLPDKPTGENWKDFLPVVRQLVRIYLIEDAKRMREYLNAALRSESRGYDSRRNAWDAYTFNNLLMKKVKGALKSLASR